MAAAVLVVLLPFTTGSTCAGSTAGIPQGAPAPPARPDPPDPRLAVVLLAAYVEPGNPYTIEFSGTDHDAGKTVHPDSNLPQNGQMNLEGQWSYTMVFPREHNVTVTLKLTAARTGSKLGYVVLDARGKRSVGLMYGNRVAVTELKVP